MSLPDLRELPINGKRAMSTHSTLELPEDPSENIWVYYSIRIVIPIDVDDFWIIILSKPMINKSLMMDLYRVHNLSALHLILGVRFTYVVEEEHLAISAANIYAAISTSHNIRICIATQGQI